MVVVALTGGMGNQLFQYAVGYALAKRRRTRLRLDLDHYDEPPVPGNPPRPYALGRLRINARRLSDVDRVGLSLPPPPGGWPLTLRAYRRALVETGREIGHRRVTDAVAGFDPGLFALPPGHVRLWGCWQSPRYFADCRADLVRQFRFRDRPDGANRAVLGRIGSAGGRAVCVHVRRGDYTRPETLTKPCPPSYYARAIGWMGERVSGAMYFVFSDDPEWARANLPVPAGTTFVGHNVGADDAEDLRLMAGCDHFIIANSTFSWWGAWLGRSADKRVVAPARWYAEPHGSEADLVPAAWTRM